MRGEPGGQGRGNDEVGGGEEGAVGGREQGQAGALPGRDAEVLQRVHVALAAALARRLEEVVLVRGVGMVVAHCLHGGLARSG